MGWFACEMNRYIVNVKLYLVVLLGLAVSLSVFGENENQPIVSSESSDLEQVDFFGLQQNPELPGDVISMVMPTLPNFTFSSLKKVDFTSSFVLSGSRYMLMVKKIVTGFFESSVSIHLLVLNHLYPFFFFF